MSSHHTIKRFGMHYGSKLNPSAKFLKKTAKDLARDQVEDGARDLLIAYAFENICHKHISEIKSSLSIGGIHSVSSSFYKKGNKQETGAQIDLLLDRNDQVINIFEIKFYSKAFTISKSYAQTLKNKLIVFEENTKTKKYLSLILITTFDITPNEYSLDLIDQVLTIDDLFKS